MGSRKLIPTCGLVWAILFTVSRDIVRVVRQIAGSFFIRSMRLYGDFCVEFTWSPVYHTPRDSVKFINLNYLTRMVKASLVTAYAGVEAFQPNGELTFSFPAGPAIVAPPWESASVEVEIGGKYGDSPDPSTVNLHYSVNGSAYEINPMAEISTGRFRAALPGAECSSRINYFISAQDTFGVDFYSPDSANPYRALVASEAVVAFDDDFETDKGWTASGDVTSGKWNRGIPVGGGDRGDPPSDFDGSGRCFATDTSDGDSDVDGGITYLVSPIMDLSGADALVHYARWYYNNDGFFPHSDTMMVFVSNNEGIDWTPVEFIGPIEEASGGWYEHSFWARDFLPLTSKMRFMFTARDVKSTIIEAAVDAFSIMSYHCQAYVCGDINGNGLVNILDATMLINYLYKGGRAPDRMAGADVNGDAAVNILDVTYLIGRLYKDGPPPVCQ